MGPISTSGPQRREFQPELPRAGQSGNGQNGAHHIAVAARTAGPMESDWGRNPEPDAVPIADWLNTAATFCRRVACQVSGDLERLAGYFGRVFGERDVYPRINYGKHGELGCSFHAAG